MTHPLDQTPVGELLAAADAGDEAAWNAIVERFSNLLWSVARSFRLSGDDAEDVVQNTWLRLLENLGRIRMPEALPGWLATTARHEALRILRKKGRDVPVRDEDLGSWAPDPLEPPIDLALLDDERDVALWTSFRQLSERCQQLLRVLMATDAPAYQEVSAAFDMPIGSIGPTRMRCLRALKRLLGDSSYSFDPRAEGWT